jgi:hypothetical protein
MKRIIVAAFCLSLCCLGGDKPDLAELPDSAAKLIEVLRRSGDRYKIHRPRVDYVKESDIPYLVSLLDSTQACAFADSIVSSIYFPGKSTVRHEAAYLIEGFWKRYYPTELTSQRFKPDIEATKQWYRMWSHLKKLAEPTDAPNPATGAAVPDRRSVAPGR